MPLLYLVPTFNNPTGRCLTADRREALAAAAQRDELTIVEDDTYRELCYDGPAPASLFTLSGGTGVARIGSFAKTVAPGLRLGWLTAAPALVRALASRGYVDSGGGVNHATALTMAEFATAGAYDRHLAAVRDRYRHQRDQLISAVRRDLPEVAFVPPAGGWFLWLRLPRPRGGTELLPAAVATGVSYLAGTHFFVADTGHEFARLAFSMLDPEVLAEGVRRLALASTAIAG